MRLRHAHSLEMRELKGLPAPLPQQQKPSNRAMKIIASICGALVGLAGMEHGFFEFLQCFCANCGDSQLSAHLLCRGNRKSHSYDSASSLSANTHAIFVETDLG